MRLSGVRVGPLQFSTGRQREGCLATFGKMLLLPLTLALYAALWPVLVAVKVGRAYPSRRGVLALCGAAVTLLWLPLLITALISAFT